MRTSEQIDKLCEALAKAQGLFTNPEKNKTARIPMKSGGEYSYDYADLPETLNVTRKPLSDCGLCHVSTVEFREDGNFLLGRLMHSSGQWIESEWLLPQNPDPKIMAGSITYGRRYLFNALTGIAADDDNDAGEVGQYKPKAKPQWSTPGVIIPPKETPKPEVKPEGKPGLSEEQLNNIKWLFATANDTGWTKEDIKEAMKVEWPEIESTKDLSRGQIEIIVNYMKSNPKQKSNPPSQGVAQ